MKENLLRKQLEMLPKEDLIDHILSEGTVQAALEARLAKNRAEIQRLISIGARLDEEMEATESNEQADREPYGVLLDKFIANSRKIAKLQSQNDKIIRLIYVEVA